MQQQYELIDKIVIFEYPRYSLFNNLSQTLTILDKKNIEYGHGAIIWKKIDSIAEGLTDPDQRIRAQVEYITKGDSKSFDYISFLKTHSLQLPIDKNWEEGDYRIHLQVGMLFEVEFNEQSFERVKIVSTVDDILTITMKE